ncbi:hypothetical protein Kpho01_61910 [Kitasatospora phosalacinea]|uniref:Uncharacterized protein n=1 Tax=Kitasatospora phosalacinea TaxID=2065 RepID=A0A9W6PND1_9ACTN|nr:hypothetical protein Kpho01_61910 [Kitasatospora phosalacinea]
MSWGRMLPGFAEARLGRRLLAFAVISLGSSTARSRLVASPADLERRWRSHRRRPIPAVVAARRPGAMRAPSRSATGLGAGQVCCGCRAASIGWNGVQPPFPRRVLVVLPQAQAREP